VIAGVMGVILLLVTGLAIVAIRGAGGTSSAQSRTPGTGPAGTADPTGPGTTRAASPGPVTPAPSGTAPPGAAPAGTFLSGRIELYGGRDALDLDTAATGYVTSGDKSVMSGDAKADLLLTPTALGTENRAAVRMWPGPGEPTAAGCASPGADWRPSAHVSVLAKNGVVCVRTSDGRLGAITLTEITKSAGGQLTGISFDYAVWKKPGDQ
jgi:hypothetical protein